MFFVLINIAHCSPQDQNDRDKVEIYTDLALVHYGYDRAFFLFIALMIGGDYDNVGLLFLSFIDYYIHGLPWSSGWPSRMCH